MANLSATNNKQFPTGLVLEGGGMRGMFTTGVIDVLMERRVADRFTEAVGVSAGACFGCNIKSRQVGRALRYNVRFAHDWRYNSVRSWVLTGGLFGPEFAYHTVPREHDVFDVAEFQRNPLRFWLVTTSVDTGKAVYHELTTGDRTDLEWIRATSSMPIAARIVDINGQRMLDGGIADSIPLQFLQERGHERCLVVLTQPRGYRKSQTRGIGAIKWWLRRHPAIAQAMEQRPAMYNAQLDYLAQQEAAGRATVIAPDADLDISRVSHDTAAMRRVYQAGRDACEAWLARQAVQ